jgi:hypothetical protein
VGIFKNACVHVEILGNTFKISRVHKKGLKIGTDIESV